MKVLFPPLKRWSEIKTGKGFFLHRLVQAITDFDIKFVDNIKEADLVFSLFKSHPQGYGPKTIARIDGMYYEQEKDPRNKSIGKHLEKCDGIIYQSNFSRKCSERFLKKYFNFKNSVKETVILNGCDISFYDKIKPRKSKFGYNIFCSSRWRKGKRLKEIIELVLSLPNTALWIAGEPDCRIKNKRIKYFGRMTQEKMSEIIKMCDACIHLCSHDSCPNGIVEAIGAGTPVLCLNNGGTPEIVGENGVISKAEIPYNFEPCDVQNLPKPNMDVLKKDLIELLLNVPIKIDRYSVDIKKTAKQYYDFFLEVLNA